MGLADAEGVSLGLMGVLGLRLGDLGSRVGGVVDLLHAGGGDVGVDLGGAEVSVAEEFLDAA